MDADVKTLPLDALLGSIPLANAGWDTAGLALKPFAGSAAPYGCPMFAPAYVGRKRWAKPFDSLSFRALPIVRQDRAQRRRDLWDPQQAWGGGPSSHF
jgi:hypothetical protein